MAALMFRTISRSLLYTEHRRLHLTGVRYLLTNNALKFDKFMEKKRSTTHYFQQNKEVYFETIQMKLQNSEAISEKDLKPMFYLSENESDVQLTKKCLFRFYEEAQTVEYKFGPLFLRLCHLLDLVDVAFELMMDESCRGAFSDYSSYNILLDMLYKHGQYERALEVLLKMKIQYLTLRKDTYLLAFAICYKLNNARSLETCTTLFEEAAMNGIAHTRLALCFVVALALKQGDYVTASSVYNRIVRKDMSLCCNLDLLLAAKFKGEEEVLRILETATERSKLDFLWKVTFSKEVMDAVEEKLHPTVSFEKFKEIYEKLGQSGQISTLTLDGMLHAVPEEQNATDLQERKNYRSRAMQKELASLNTM
ncbi:pentatricopeptide repeat-containing protein 2, mitochondrial [Rana temporaria]|uniref:pentatricopeptide repeat-containing protein 2, mitochondrial n=1 Tax=Rana temporaria TaxID=8407 RepID=UPI001AADAE19|nr:pentatricopeptide repeat-containing protein 2, mitochondrial [Rana temporaria]